MDTMSSSGVSSSDVSASSYFQEMIQRRQMLQAQRIAQGVESGRITEKEASRLGRLEARVDKLAQTAMDDGSVSGKEFAKIMRAQNLVGDSIHRVSRDGPGGDGPDAAQDSNGRYGPGEAQGAGGQASVSGAGVSGAMFTSAGAAEASSSNASISSGSLLGEMSKLFLDLAQLRQDMQDERIARGVESGRITEQEQQLLEGRKEATADLVSQAGEDGLVSMSEFVQILRAQNATSRAVFKYSHNQDMASQSQTGGAARSQGVKSVNVKA